MLHAVRLEGFAPVGRIPRYGLPEAKVAKALQDHRAHGLVEHSEFAGSARGVS